VPKPVQTTAAYTAEMPDVLNKDTRPVFLGGSFKSKVQGVSEVSQYINRSRANKKLQELQENYFQAKLEIKSTLD